MNEITIQFWIDDHIHAIRHTNYVPNVGDEVRFNDIAYKLFYKIWIYDDPKTKTRVAFNMEKVNNE